MRHLLRAALFGSLIALAPAAHAQQKTVNVYNWSDYIDRSILEDFEKETGIKVVYDTYDSNELLETKLLAGSSGYDVVVPSATFLSRQIKAGVFRKLDKSKLPNLVHAWDEIQTRVARFDPNNEYSVNYLWGTSGVGYNVAKVRERLPNPPTDSWRMVLDPVIAAKFADCGIYVLDSPEDVIPNVLNYLGLDPNSKKAADLSQATAQLNRVRKHIRKFHSSEYIDALANGEICLAVGYSGDILQARDRAKEAGRGVEVAYSIPKEGALMWFDQLAIPNDSFRPEEAHQFINYLLRPEVIAKATNEVNYANGNKTSQQFVEESVLKDPSIYPDPVTLQRLFTVTTPDSQEQKRITRAWTRIKTGK